MSNKITLNNISKVVWKNLIVILVITIIGSLAGGFYAEHKKHTSYVADRSLMISHGYNDSTANEQVQADLSLTKTYKGMLDSIDVANAARKTLPKKLQKKYSASEIQSMIRVKTVDQSLVLDVSVRANRAKDATKIVNAVVDAAQTELPKMSPSVGTVSTFAKAKTSDATSQTSPSAKKYALLGAAVGLLVGMVLAFSITTWKNLI